MKSKREKLPSYLQYTLKTSTRNSFWGIEDQSQEPISGFGPAAMGFTLLACLNAPLGMIFGLLGVGTFPAVLLGILPALAVAGCLFWQSHKAGKGNVILAPTSAREQIIQVRHSFERLSDALDKDPSPEVLALAQHGLRLVDSYDLLLDTWARSAWVDEASPETKELSEAAATLAKTIVEHRDAVRERQEWEKDQVTALREPQAPFLTQDTSTLVSFVLADAQRSSEHLDQDRKRVQLDRQALTDLGGHVPARSELSPSLLAGTAGSGIVTAAPSRDLA